MRHDRRYLEDILEAIEKIEQYTASGLDVLEHDPPLKRQVATMLDAMRQDDSAGP